MNYHEQEKKEKGIDQKVKSGKSRENKRKEKEKENGSWSL